LILKFFIAKGLELGSKLFGGGERTHSPWLNGLQFLQANV
jgi:hypothetical protein